MIRDRWWLVIGGFLTLALAVALGDDAARPDPLPLRRIQIGPERVAAELDRVQKGTLVLLPRTEFEAKVQQAALAVEVAETPPRLTKTRYSARLADQALVGEAEWLVMHTAPGPGKLPLADFNLALGKRVKVAGAGAILGDLDGKTPGLWIDKPGQPTIKFDWSRRGTLVGEDLHFDLQVPACANAQLELKLPQDYWLVASKAGLLVDGPAGADQGLRTWLVSFSGRSRVEFSLRRLESGSALLLAEVEGRQELSPDHVLADFEFKIEALHGTVSQLTFDGDKSLQPYDVTIGGVEVKNWEWQPAAGGKETADGVLVVPLREPLDGGLPVVRVRCLTPLDRAQKDRVWVSPGLHLRGALSRGETLVLHALAEAQLGSWKAGQFRLTKTTSELDGSQTLTLVQGGLAPGRVPANIGGLGKPAAMAVAGKSPSPGPPRPSAVLQARPTEILLEQQSWWQLDMQGSTLTVELACKPIRGQVYHLPLKLPAESQVAKLTVEPNESLRSSATAGTLKTPLLLIDLAPPATSERPVKIQVQLRLPPRLTPSKGQPPAQPFPDVEPMVPCLRTGALAISVHAGWQAQVLKSSVPATAAPEGEGPWRQAPPDYFFAFRGTKVTGLLRLFKRATQYQAHCQSDAFINDAGGTLVTRLTIEPTRGSLDHVDLLVSTKLKELRAESIGPRIVAVNVQPASALDARTAFLAFGARHGLEALNVFAAEPGLQRWRLDFAEPVGGRITLVLEASFDPLALVKKANALGERPWAVPVVVAVGAGQFEGELAVQLVGAEITGFDADQLAENAPVPGKQVWRVYRYEGLAAAGKLPSLHVLVRKAHANAVDLAGRETCDRAALTTCLEQDGRLMHHFHFRLINWRKNQVPVQLPSGARVLAARTAGRWLPSLEQQDGKEGVKVGLPASGVAGEQNFDLYYSTPGNALTWVPWQTLVAALPELPVLPLDLRQSWVVPTGVMPLGGGWQRVSGGPSASDSKEVLGTARRSMPAPGDGQPLLSAFMPDEYGPDWTHWEAASAGQMRLEMVVVRPVALRVLGVFMGGVFVLAWGLLALRMRSARGQAWLFRLLVLWTGLATLTALWLPTSVRAVAAWSAAAGVALGAAWCLIKVLQRRSPAPAKRPSPARSAVAAGAVLLALAMAAGSLPPAWSQGADLGTVLILPGPANAPDRQDALVTPDLLKRLETLSKRSPSALRGAVLIAAEYRGTVAPDVAVLKADFEAEFHFYSFGDKATLAIPLAGVELGEGAQLDRALVQPVSAPGGYSIAVTGKGPHALTLKFSVRLQATSEHRDLRFTVPRLFQSKLILKTSGAWPAPQVLAGFGRVQRTTLDSPNQELMVDLGRDSTVQLRWAGGNPTAPAAKVEVREAYCWDLRSPGSTCTAVLNYHVKGGSVTQFSVTLPATLEPRAVEVVGEGLEGDDGTRPHLRDWRLTTENGQRRLDVQLQAPASGNVLVTLHLVPWHPLGPGTVRLQLPLPLRAESAGGLVGYRADDFDVADKAINLTTSPLAADRFAQQWQDLGGHEASLPTHAFSFAKRHGESALVVSLTARPLHGEQDLLWTLYPARAELAATLKATAAGDDLMLIEWEVPPKFVVAEIAGDNLRSWTRAAAEGRVQVWLKHPARDVSLSLRGWVTHSELSGGQALRWALPWVSCSNLAKVRTVVRVANGGGVRVEPTTKKFVNLAALPPPAVSAWVCQGPQNRYGAEFLLRAMSQPARVAAVSTIEAPEGKLRFASQWQILLPHGGSASFQVRVANWQGPPLALVGPSEVTIRKLTAPPGQQRWQVNVAAGTPRRFQLKLLGDQASQAGKVVDMPFVRLEGGGAVWSGHWLATQSPGLAVQTTVGLTPVKAVQAEPGLPVGAAERLGSQARVWKIAAADWKLAFVARPTVTTPGLRVLAAEQEIAFGEGFGWIHQTGFWIHAKDTSELAINMPTGATLLAVSFDGVQVSTPPAAAARLALVLPPGEGQHRVQLRWAFGSKAEALDQPQLAVPAVEGVATPPITWALTLPSGYRLTDADATGKTEAAAPVGRGTVVRWQSESQPQTPLLQLISVERDAQRQTWTVTGCVILAMLGVLALSFVPPRAARFPKLWPARDRSVS